LMFWFYEGIYKVAHWSNYAFWVKHAPLLKPVWQVLTYVIPLGEIILSVMLLFFKYRKVALYGTIGALMISVFWIISVYLFTNRLFWPYHALWNKSTWVQKMSISLALSWLSFVGIILLNSTLSFRGIFSNSLRNKPANAS